MWVPVVGVVHSAAVEHLKHGLRLRPPLSQCPALHGRPCLPCSTTATWQCSSLICPSPHIPITTQFYGARPFRVFAILRLQCHLGCQWRIIISLALCIAPCVFGFLVDGEHTRLFGSVFSFVAHQWQGKIWTITAAAFKISVTISHWVIQMWKLGVTWFCKQKICWTTS